MVIVTKIITSNVRLSRELYTNDIRSRLHDNLFKLFNDISGKSFNPRRSNKTQLFWGGNGSIRVYAYGDKRGLWIDRKDGVGGDVFKAIEQYARVSGFAAQVEWAADWLGVPQFDPGSASKIDRDQVAARLAETKRLAEERAKCLADEEARYAIKAVRYAQWEYNKTSPRIDATPGAIYIRQERKIPIVYYPASVRWHSGRQALAFTITNRDGSLKTIQFVAVTPEGLKDAERIWNTNNPDNKRPKHTLGPIGDEGALRLAGPKDGPLVVVEGPETALSTWAAGFDTIATIGPITINKLIANIERGRKIVIGFDDDPIRGGNNPKREYQRKRMIRKLQRDGYDVVAVKPFEIRRYKKQDFNDLIKERGVDGVRARINSYVQPKIADISFMAAPDARQKLDDLIESNMHSMVIWERKDDSEFAPSICIKVTAGVGKTAAYIRAIKPTLRAMRARGDMRSIVISLPFHDLGDDVRDRYHHVYKKLDAAIEEAQAEGGDEFRIAGYRGREARRHRSDELMCGNIDDVRIAHKRRVDITKEICESECSLRDSCSYLAQRDQTADIWLVSHSRLFSKMPAPISKTGVAMVIADETAWRPALDVPDVLIPIREIEDMPLGDGDKFDVERFADIRSKIVAAALANGDGPLKAKHLTELGLTTESADFAIEREYIRIVVEGPWRERIVNESVGQMLRNWQSVKELLASNKPESGWLRVERDEAKRIVLRVRGAMKVSKDWRIPTLHVDASTDIPMLRHFWPGLIDGGSFDVDVAHTKIYQVIDNSFAKSKFEPLYGEIKDENGEKIQKQRADDRRRLRAFIAKIHRKHSDETLVITNKRIKDALDLDDIPGISTGHFNAIAGKDGWGQVSAAIIIGRTQPPIDEVTRMAEALTGDVIQTDTQYSRRDGVRISRRDGQLLETRCEVEFHPHPVAERIRYRVCEGEIYQSLHRARPVNRTADKPVTIYLLNDLAIDIPIDGFIEADRIRYPSPRDQMLAEGGVAFATAASSSLAYPHIWATPGHLRKVMFMRRRAEEENGVIRAISVTSTYNKLSIGPGNAVPEIADGVIRVRFQRQGPKLHREEAYYDPRRVEDPRAVIEGMIGPLSWFEGPDPKVEDVREIQALPMAVGSDLIIEAQDIAPPDRIVVRIEERARAQSYAGAVVIGFMSAKETPDGAPRSPANDLGDVLIEREQKIHIPPDIWARVWMVASDSNHSHEYVAENCNVSLAHLSNIEAGRRSGTQELLAGLERYIASAKPIQGRLL